MLDRTAESQAALAALASGRPVELYGESGIGKTTLLNHLANAIDASVFPDGIACLSARRCSADDVHQELYEAFYECAPPFKPSDTVLRQALGTKRALILLDDSALQRDDAEELLDVAPQAAIAFGSPDRRVWRAEAAARAVKGLPTSDALALAEREMGRPFSDAERPLVSAICTAVRGHPLRIMQAMASVRDDERPLADVATELGATVDAAPPVTASEQSVLDALSTVAAPLDIDAIRAIAPVPDLDAALASLEKRHLVRIEGGRYRAATANAG
jgi:hypothetical protein